MIYVSKENFDQVEYLIQQSIQGNHILFDLDTVRRVFSQGPLNPIATDHLPTPEAYSVEHHIERLIVEPTLLQKKAYLEQLDGETLEKVVKTYFNIIENNLYENLEVQH